MITELANNGYLTFGLIVFFGIHIIPITPLRAGLTARLGAGAYRGIFSAVSLIGLVLIIMGYRAGSDTTDLWAPMAGSHQIAMIAAPVIFTLFVAANMNCRIKGLVRHPLSLGMLLWSGTHLLANGDALSAVIFMAFGLYAGLNIIFGKQTRTGEVPPPPSRDVIAIGAGIALSILFYNIHAYVGGVALG